MPGGKVDSGESALQAAPRESYEELAAFGKVSAFQKLLRSAPFTDTLGYKARFFKANALRDLARKINKNWQKRLKKKKVWKKHAFREKDKWMYLPLHLLQGKAEDHNQLSHYSAGRINWLYL